MSRNRGCVPIFHHIPPYSTIFHPIFHHIPYSPSRGCVPIFPPIFPLIFPPYSHIPHIPPPLSAPTTATAGQAIAISDTTQNIGKCPAGVSTTKFYLSTDNRLGPGDKYLGGRTVPSLTAGASSSGSTTVTIPTSVPAGNYYIIAVADGNRVVAEVNERNNAKAKPITVTSL